MHKEPEADGSLGVQAASHGPDETEAAERTAAPHSRGGAPDSAADQVSVQLGKAAPGKNDQMVINLKPVELGNVEVKLDFGADGRVQASIMAERPETLEMLQKDQPTLERALNDAGLQTDPGSLSFNLKGQGQGGNQRQFAGYNQPGAGRGKGFGMNIEGRRYQICRPAVQRLQREPQPSRYPHLSAHQENKHDDDQYGLPDSRSESRRGRCGQNQQFQLQHQYHIDSNSSAKLTQSYDSFLKLLTTQMQNQDPLSPMESSEFTNQLVQFSQVEQQISQNTKLDKLVSLQNNNQTQASLGFIGLDVEATGNAFTYDGSTPTKMSYTLPETSTSTAIQIKNDKGVTVQTINGVRSTSRQELSWDGKKSDGTAAPAGDYTMTVMAPKADSKLMTAKTTVFGRVSGISLATGLRT